MRIFVHTSGPFYMRLARPSGKVIYREEDVQCSKLEEGMS